ncbi:flagellin N-terminal helical domain-containing protein, partial [Actinoplanes regularis]
KVAVRNTQDGISVAQTAEGSLNEATAILQRMRDLSVQTSNQGSMDADAKDAANKELQQLNQELDRIGASTSFGKSKLLDGSFGATSKATSAAMPKTGGGDTDALTAVGGPFASATDFTITELDGTTLATPITVNVAAVPGGTPQDIAKAVNTSLADALKKAGFEGNELKMTASTDATGSTTFSMSSVGSFKTADGTGGPLTAVGLDAQTSAGVLAGSVPNGNTGRFQVGANANERIGIAIGEVNSKTLGTASLDLTKLGGPDEAIAMLDKAIRSVSDTRASLGAY